jgi:dipeptidyl aminopeptidase/acylaminoacyl peptidase
MPAPLAPSPSVWRALALGLVLVASVGAQSTEPRPLSPEQVMRLRQVLHAEASPDGQWLLLTHRVPRPLAEGVGGARRQVTLMPVGEKGGDPVRVAPDAASVADPRWRPDGKAVSFLMRGEGDEAPQVYEWVLGTERPRRLSAHPQGVRAHAWRPDGTAIAFSSRDPRPQEAARLSALGLRVEVFEEDWSPISLHLLERGGGKVRRLTKGVTVHDFAWHPDGARLAAKVAPTPSVDDRYVGSKLRWIAADGSGVQPYVDNPGKLGAFAFSPGGGRLAYVGAQDLRDPHAGMLFVADAEGRTRALLPGLRGMVHEVHWWGEDHLDLVLSRGVQTSIERYAFSDGSLTPLVSGRVAFRTATRSQDGYFVCGSTGQHPEELFLAAGDRFVRRTDSNPWLAAVALGPQERVRFAARDGLEIEGLLISPPGRPDGALPLVIVAHGGPEAHFSDGWLTRYSTWGQVLAGRGYRVWFPNYRASTGYGVAFAKADHGDPMGGQFEDHLDAIEHLAGRGLVDPSRVGIGGGSYGGYTAAWAATRHGEHFAAAVSFVPFVDIYSKWMSSDIPKEFHRVHYRERWPQAQRDLLDERSPLSWAAGCRTPLLLLGGTSDPRVHPAQPLMLYRAVKLQTDTPVRYVRYGGEGHGNARNWHQYDYLLRTLRWFEHYLKPGARRSDPPPSWGIPLPQEQGR